MPATKNPFQQFAKTGFPARFSCIYNAPAS
jgi:hypothetical protein